MKERTGSSQYAIQKFIEEKQKSLPPTFRKLLLVNLKRLVASGKLVKVKGSFKLPSANSSAVPAAPIPDPVKKKANVSAKVAKPAAKGTKKTRAVVVAVKPKAKVAAKAKPKTKTKTVAAVSKTKAVAAKPKAKERPAKAARTSSRTSPGKKAAAPAKKAAAAVTKKAKATAKAKAPAAKSVKAKSPAKRASTRKVKK